MGVKPVSSTPEHQVKTQVLGAIWSLTGISEYQMFQVYWETVCGSDVYHENMPMSSVFTFNTQISVY